MADRRMFSRQIVESDVFLGMKLRVQALYLHLCMNADDEGFVNNPIRIAKYIGAKQSDLNELLENRFLLEFESGVVVIKHWRLNNHMRKDRYNATKYAEERTKLYIKSNGSYTLDPKQSDDDLQNNVNQVVAKCQPNVNQVVDKTHPSISLVQVSTEQVSTVQASTGHCVAEDSEVTSVEFFEENFRRPISQPEFKRLENWMQVFPMQVINYAIEQSVLSDKRSFRYVEAILRTWQSSGVKSIQDAERQVSDFEKKKASAGTKGLSSHQDVLPEYMSKIKKPVKSAKEVLLDYEKSENSGKH